MSRNPEQLEAALSSVYCADALHMPSLGNRGKIVTQIRSRGRAAVVSRKKENKNCFCMFLVLVDLMLAYFEITFRGYSMWQVPERLLAPSRCDSTPG